MLDHGIRVGLTDGTSVKPRTRVGSIPLAQGVAPITCDFREVVKPF